MSATDDWFTQMKIKAHERYRKEQAEGLHDNVCEWDIDFRLCHCHRRARLAKGLVEAPVMIYSSPVCEGCGQMCVHDGDGFGCPTCKVDFGNAYDEPGTWTDEHATTDAELLAQRARALVRVKPRDA